MQSRSKNTFTLGESIDCLDACGKWLHAKVIDKKQGNISSGELLKVTYLDFSSKYDEWVAPSTNRILKKFKPETEFDDLRVGNIVDILDK
jgi:hypothetical protein